MADAKKSNTGKIIIGTVIGLGLIVTTLIILKKKGIIMKDKTVVDPDKQIADLFVKINALTQAERNAKMSGSILTPTERSRAMILMLKYGKDKTSLTPAEKTEVFGLLNKVYGVDVNATGDTGKGARSWHIPVYYPRNFNR
jgi:hypothetical protein